MKNTRSYAAIAYLFLAPALILMGVFTFWPVGFNTYLAFQDYSIADGTATWNNFAHFKYIFHEELFWNALKNSLLYLLIVPVIQLGALVLAKLVNNKLPGMTFFPRHVLYPGDYFDFDCRCGLDLRLQIRRHAHLVADQPGSVA